MRARSNPGQVLRVLLLDDKGGGREIARELVRLGCQVALERSVVDAVAQIRRVPYDLALWTIGRQTPRGLEAVSLLLETAPALDVVVIARQAAFETAVEAMRRGARDYVGLPLEPGFLPRLVGDALARGQNASQPAGPRDPAARPLAALGGPFTLEEIEEEHVRRILLSTASIDEAARILKLRPRSLRRRLGRATPGTSPSPAVHVLGRD
ncbi:MAG TPA: response regulator [Anaeromyxobacteraceae bacterium]